MTTVKETALKLAHEAGAILLRHFGRIKNVRQKAHPSSVVCEADLASESHIVRGIRSRFPNDNIIAEESGYTAGSSEVTWVIDPLDGTSNFVAGIPWFGVQIGVLKGATAVFAVIYLPTEKAVYHAEFGHGAYKNGKRMFVTRETRLKNVLCGFGFDATAGRTRSRANAALLMRVAGGVRNTRATNSLIDFCYTIEGHFGGCINLNCKIWDIVPVSLLLPEAGGRFTDLQGKRIQYQCDPESMDRNYGVLGASKTLHPQLLRLLRSGGRPRLP
jgi:myo-inositol-1(or 4)-monophosphatase